MTFDLNNATVEYSGIPALQNATLQYDGNGVVLLTGATGAGKTTLLRLLYADAIPTAGSVVINGQSTTKMAAKVKRSIRSRLGIVQQDCKLVSEYTVFENILMAYAMRKISKAEANKSALELLADFGISYVRHKLPRHLSGGEKHLVALARASAMQPEVIIADEPTGTLDDETAQMVALQLTDAVKRGTGLIVSTHSEKFADAFPDARRFVLNEGLLSEAKKEV